MSQTTSQEFLMKPVVVEAWHLQQDNLDLIAQWCKGRRRGLSVIFPKIRNRAKTIDSQDTNHYAIVGDWIVKTKRGFIKMSNRDFNATYAPTGARSVVQ